LDDNGRSTAYADLLSALLALRADPATSRFDAELAAAEAGGLVDGAVARTLRWWQRESMRGVADHLAAVLPDLLTELRESDRAAVETVRAAQSSWAEATAALPTTGPLQQGGSAEPDGPRSSASVPAPVPGTPHLRPVDDIDDSLTRPPLRKAPPAPPGSAPVDVPIVAPPRHPGDVLSPEGTPVPGTAGLPPVSPLPLRPGFAPAQASPSTTPTAPVVRAPDTGSTTPAPTDPEVVTDDTSEASAGTPPTGAPRTRLLVAGLTVLTDAVSDQPVGPGTASTDGDDEPSTADDSPEDPA
jgi:hypothetical protein